MKLLLVEDDPSMRAALERSLGRRGWQVRTCADGHAALGAWQAFTPDVVALDLSLPGRDGLQVLEQARCEGIATPVLLLTARGTVGDRVLGLNAGADDYLPKPFGLDELEARLRALARRRGAPPPATPGETRVGRLRLDRGNGAFYLDGGILELTPRESALLQGLFAHPGHAVAKERLFELVFPDQPDVQYEAIEVVAYRLRKKLDGTGACLMTLRGLGYLVKPE